MSAAADLSRIELAEHELFASEDAWQIEAELGRRSFRDFHQMSWHVIEPGKLLKNNWHIDAITDHAQAVAEGEIRDLLINVPPRCTKSTPISVQLQPWIWTWDPSREVLGCSHTQPLAERFSRKSRLLLQSPWYQRRWGGGFNIAADQNAKRRWENDKNGSRQALSVEKGTGDGGDLILVDDPHNVQATNSPTELATVRTWWSETMSTRLNDPETGGRIVIMQRIHEYDLAGYILARDQDWVHLNLPMEYEGRCVVDLAHICSQNVYARDLDIKEEVLVHDSGTSLGFKDPRTKVQTDPDILAKAEDMGELLTPDRFNTPAVQKLKRELGSYATAGQLGQRPGPREGGMFMVSRIKLVREIPPGIVKICRGWDKAATEGGGCSTAGVKIGRYADGRFIFLHCKSDHVSTGKREEMMLQQAEIDGVECSIVHEQEPGSGGKDSAIATSHNLAAFDVKAKPATGDKITRADPMARAIERGDFDMLEGSWNQEFIDEMKLWPNSKEKDKGDAAATSYNEIALGGTGWVDLYPTEGKPKGNGGMVFGDDAEEGGLGWAQM